MKIDPKLLIVGGAALLWLGRGNTGMQGLGFNDPPAPFDPIIALAKQNDWLTYIPGKRSGSSSTFRFTPMFNSATWTMDERAFASTRRGDWSNRPATYAWNASVIAAKKTPIILKATTIEGLKTAVKSMKKSVQKAMYFTSLSKPNAPRYKFRWDVDERAQKYVDILNGAIAKGEKAIAKADKAATDKEAWDALESATKLPEPPTTPPATDGPRVSTGLLAPIKNSWQDLIKIAPPANTLPDSTPPGQSPAVRSTPEPRSYAQGPDAMRAPVPAATTTPASPTADINPLAAGAAAAVPLILAAFF